MIKASASSTLDSGVAIGSNITWLPSPVADFFMLSASLAFHLYKVEDGCGFDWDVCHDGLSGLSMLNTFSDYSKSKRDGQSFLE